MSNVKRRLLRSCVSSAGLKDAEVKEPLHVNKSQIMVHHFCLRVMYISMIHLIFCNILNIVSLKNEKNK